MGTNTSGSLDLDSERVKVIAGLVMGVFGVLLAVFSVVAAFGGSFLDFLLSSGSRDGDPSSFNYLIGVPFGVMIVWAGYLIGKGEGECTQRRR